MRVGMVLANQPFPPDIRVTKEADVLAEGGHECYLLCRGGDGRPPIEETDGVVAVRHTVHRGSAVRRKLDSLRFLITLDSPSWRRAMVSLVTEHRAEAIHVHDLHYAKSAVRAARRAGVPVVLDLHENLPAAFEVYDRRGLDAALFSAARARRLERWATRAADRVIVVVDEARERLVSAGVDPARVVVFGNAEPRALAGSEPPPLDYRRGPRLVYVGGIAQLRGLDTAVAAMPAILASRPDARLTIVGAGDTLGALEAQAARIGVSNAVVFTGWLPLDEAMDQVRDANVAVVPHHRSELTDTTIPHKLFQYMSLGRPVLVSDCAPLARVVRDAGCGAVFAAGDAEDFAARALELADPATGRPLGEAGRAAVLDRYNLEADAPALLGVYEELAPNGAPQEPAAD